MWDSTIGNIAACRKTPDVVEFLLIPEGIRFHKTRILTADPSTRVPLFVSDPCDQPFELSPTRPNNFSGLLGEYRVELFQGPLASLRNETGTSVVSQLAQNLR